MQGKRYVLDTKLERKNIIPLRFVDFPWILREDRETVYNILELLARRQLYWKL